MQRIITAIILAPLVLLAVFKAPLWLYAVMLAIVALLCADEYLDIAAAHNLKPLRALTYLSIIAVLSDYYLSIVIRSLRPAATTGWQMLRDPIFQYEVLLVLVSAAPFVLLICAMKTEELR